MRLFLLLSIFPAIVFAEPVVGHKDPRKNPVVPGLGAEPPAKEAEPAVPDLAPLRESEFRPSKDMRLKNGRWWWHHRNSGRWLFWNGDHWSWRDPSGVLFYFGDDGDFYPDSEPAPVPPAPPAASPGPSPAPAKDYDTGPPLPLSEKETFVGVDDPDAPTFYYSDDGSRLVQVSGKDHSAILFDSTLGGAPEELAKFGPRVKNVKFSGKLAGETLQITVTHDDGSTARFKSDGSPMK